VAERRSAIDVLAVRDIGHRPQRIAVDILGVRPQASMRTPWAPSVALRSALAETEGDAWDEDCTRVRSRRSMFSWEVCYHGEKGVIRCRLPTFMIRPTPRRTRSN
jgi:hypothetical protein